MHEFSVANQALDQIMGVAASNGARHICKVEITIGSLSMISHDQFRFWLGELLNSQGEIAAGVKLDVKPQPAVVECRACSYQGSLKSRGEDHFNPIFSCPQCASMDLKIMQGRECTLTRVQIET